MECSRPGNIRWIVLSGGSGVEGALEVPVGRDPEPHPVALPVDHEPGGDRLHAAGGQAGHDLLPQHRGDLVAVEAVQDPARLLGLDQVHVELAGVLRRLLDGGLGDLVEDHPLDRDVLRLQLVEQVPGDRLALAVLIGGEVELVGVLEQALELGDVRLLVAGHDVIGLEVVLDVDGEPSPRLVLDLRGGVGGALRKVADVADRGLDDVPVAEVPADGAGLGRGLDDHQLVRHVLTSPTANDAREPRRSGLTAEHGSACCPVSAPVGLGWARVERLVQSSTSSCCGGGVLLVDQLLVADRDHADVEAERVVVAGVDDDHPGHVAVDLDLRVVDPELGGDRVGVVAVDLDGLALEVGALA